MWRCASAFFILSVACAEAEPADEALCAPKTKSQLSVSGDYKNQHFVFMITVDGVPLPDEHDVADKEVEPCPLVS